MSKPIENHAVYTPYGYGHYIDKRELHTVVKYTWGGIGYLRHTSVLETVPFIIKVFAGDRPALEISWPVQQPFRQLYTELAAKLALPPHIYTVLYYPKGTLRTLLPSESPMSVGLKAHSTLVALRGVKRQQFAWDEGKKGKNITVINNKLTVNKQTGDNYEMVLGNLVLSSGRHYWELTIDSYIEEEDFFIGVAAEGTPLQGRPCDANTFWGYVGSNAMKVGPDGICENYGDAISTGDVIGVSLEFIEQLGCLSFSKNGTDFGTAFTEIPQKVLPALSLFYVNAQATLGFR